MSLKPISIRDMEDQSGDIYESVVVMSKRAKQVLSDRIVEEIIESNDEEELGVYDELIETNPDDYEELVKPTTVSVNEFLDGEIDMDVTEKAKEIIMPLIEAGKEVHINLNNVQYMDSSGISILIESHQKANELGTKVILKEISKSVLKVIMMAKLEQILNIE